MVSLSGSLTTAASGWDCEEVPATAIVPALSPEELVSVDFVGFSFDQKAQVEALAGADVDVRSEVLGRASDSDVTGAEGGASIILVSMSVVVSLSVLTLLSVLATVTPGFTFVLLTASVLTPQSPNHGLPGSCIFLGSSFVSGLSSVLVTSMDGLGCTALDSVSFNSGFLISVGFFIAESDAVDSDAFGGTLPTDAT